MRLCFALFELWAPHGPLHDAFPCRPSARFVVVRFYGSSGGRAMSALGQKQTCAAQQPMSALPPKATSNATYGDVRFGPIADIRTTSIGHLFDHCAGAHAAQRSPFVQ